MDRTSAPGNLAGQFTDGDPGLGQPAAVLDSLWTNGVQNELVALIEDTDQTPDAALINQIRKALPLWVGRDNVLFNGNLRQRFDGRNNLSTYTPDLSGSRIADGWILKSDVSTIISNLNPTGFKINGSGNLGDIITIEQEWAGDVYNYGVYNLGIAPAPEEYYTAAIRAGTLAADASVGLDMSIEHNAEIDSGVTVTDLTSTDAVIGSGGIDTYALASTRYKTVGKLDKGTITRPIAGPKITFTLKATGNFVIRIGGIGLWKSHITDNFIPSAIMSNAVRDEAFAYAQYTGRYKSSVTGKGFVAPCKPNDPSFNVSAFRMWVPWNKALAFTPVPGDVTTLNPSNGVVYGNASSKSVSSFPTIAIDDVNANGISFHGTASHSALDDAYAISFDMVCFVQQSP